MPLRRARDAAAEQTAGNPQLQDIFARLLHVSENFVPVAIARNAGVDIIPSYSDPEVCEAWIVQIERTLERLYVAPEGDR